MIPLRLFFCAFAAGASSIYYLSRNHEINRIRRLKLSVDMMVNVGARSVLAAGVADVVTRKLFVNYDRVVEHKVAKNEVSKIMRTMPNARPYLAPHQRPNSYYYAL